MLAGYETYLAMNLIMFDFMLQNTYKFHHECHASICIKFGILGAHILMDFSKKNTRTTRTPAFWGYPPPPHDYPYHWVILDPKSKEDKVKVTNLKNLPIKPYTRHTFWSCSIRCANIKWVRWVLLKIQSRHDSVHRRTDGWTDRRTERETDKVKPIFPPFNFVEAGGIITSLLTHWSYISLALFHWYDLCIWRMYT